MPPFIKFNGADDRNRTCNLNFTRVLHHLLCYISICLGKGFFCSFPQHYFLGRITKTKCNPLIMKTALSFCCNLLSLRGCYYETPKPLLYLGEQSQRVLTRFKLTMSSSFSSRTKVKSLLLKDSSHYCLFYRRIESHWVQRWDSNPQLTTYEDAELPLLYSAI